MKKPTGLAVPKPGQRGAKIAVYGRPGTGKTKLTMSSAKSAKLLLVDAEGRSELYDPAKYNFEVVYSKDVNKAIEVLAYAEALHKAGEKVVFGVDSFSSMWFAQQEVAEGIATTSRGTPTFQAWGPAKAPLKKFYARLFQTPVDVIITMRAKPEFDTSSRNPDNLEQDKPDMERGLAYTVDTILEMQTKDVMRGKALKPEDYFAIVTKTSGPAEGNPLPIGTRITNPSFDKIKVMRLSGTEHGRGVMIDNGGVELQVLKATVKNREQLKAWGATLSSKPGTEIIQELEEKFGKLTAKQLPKYIDYIWELYGHQSG